MSTIESLNFFLATDLSRTQQNIYTIRWCRNRNDLSLTFLLKFKKRKLEAVLFGRLTENPKINSTLFCEGENCFLRAKPFGLSICFAHITGVTYARFFNGHCRLLYQL